MILFAIARLLDATHRQRKSISSSVLRRFTMSRKGRDIRGFARYAVALTVMLSLSVGSSSMASATSAPSTSIGWQATWTSPTDFATGLAYNSTVRDIATVAVAGNVLRLTFSNLWSSTATTFADVTIGVQQFGDNVVPGSLIPVTFSGRRLVTIGPRAQVTSDAVTMRVTAGESLAVTIAVSGPATVSAHYCCLGRDDSYATNNGAGNLSAVPTGAGFNTQLPSWYMRWLSEISVAGSPAQGAVVAFGDSITDGFGYTNNGFSWVNALQSRINQLPASSRMSVVNEGIAGNTLTVFPARDSYATLSGGFPGVTRLQQDALSLAGVRAVIMLLGTNDIWFGAGGRSIKPIPPYGGVASIEAGMRQVIAATHAKGLVIYGVTLLPRATSTAADHDEPENWTPAEQSVMSAVNDWMLAGNSGFDGVINLGALMGDVYNGACLPTTPFAAYFNPDHLHPNVAGETVMADAISTTLFGMPEAPQVPQLVTATPTPGCAGAVLASQVLAAGSQPTATTTTPTTTTTTIPTTTTTRPAGLLKGRAATYAALVLIVLILLSLTGLLLGRRRASRRRAAHRRARLRANYPRPPPPPARRPPPGTGPSRR